MDNPRLLALLVALAGAAGSAAGASSPFLPPSAPATVAGSSGETLEFAGALIGKTTELLFVDKATKKGRFVTVGETVDGLQVLRYDPEREQAEVRINGAPRTLALRKAAGPANAPAPVPPQPTGFAVAPPPAPAPATAPAVATLSEPPAVASNPAPAVAATPAGPVTPEVQAKQEQDARNLVSDLLEIGMVQRKAYEEAMRKQQSGAAPAPGPGR